jgi:CDP-diacylglycerol pyrophosphatase
MLPRRSLGLSAVAVAAVLLIAVVAVRAADPDALWKIVNGQCVPDAQLHADPSPCSLVNFLDGYAILKDRDGATQFLLIPTTRITGIESPELLAPNAPNYFADAWGARSFVDETARRRLPRDALSLAINSESGRTQNQLHIHIDCVRADVRDALAQHTAAIGGAWAPFPVPLAGHSYRAMRVAGDTLANANPFKLLADGVPGARDDMGQQTLVTVGATMPDGKPGFVLLNDHVDAATGDRASGEELQDHDCALARTP